METVLPVIKTLWLPVLLYTVLQTVILYFIGLGSSGKIGANRLRKFSFGLGAVLLVGTIGFLKNSTLWPLLFGGVLLGLWLLSHLLAYAVSLYIERRKNIR